MADVKTKPKKISDYEEALASEDPRIISNGELEDLAKHAIKKFKSL